MSELRKDLLNILTKEVVRWGDDAETRKPGAYFLAACLEELGYAKVVRCRECKHYEDCNHWLPILEENLWFCSEGERVVAKDATGEEVPNGR